VPVTLLQICPGSAQLWLGNHVAGEEFTCNNYKLYFMSCFAPVLRADNTKKSEELGQSTHTVFHNKHDVKTQIRVKVKVVP